MKSVLRAAHARFVFQRRVRLLADALAKELPQNATVLDVGAGEGSIALAVLELRPDVRIAAIDVFVRPNAQIPITLMTDIRFPSRTARLTSLCSLTCFTTRPNRVI